MKYIISIIIPMSAIIFSVSLNVLSALKVPVMESGIVALQNKPDTKPKKTAEYRRISTKKAKEMMSGDFILLDVRTEEEFKEKRIRGAILIPDYEIDERAEDELLDKDSIILVYCRSGRRSANVARMLVAMGYTNVYDFGGIIDWPYDTISN